MVKYERKQPFTGHIQVGSRVRFNTHRDVESCLGTHVIPLEETWSPEWGGQLRFYEDAVIPEDYKNIMKKLVSRHPPPLAMTLLNQYKSTGWTPPHNFELEMDAQESVIFKNSKTVTRQK